MNIALRIVPDTWQVPCMVIINDTVINIKITIDNPTRITWNTSTTRNTKKYQEAKTTNIYFRKLKVSLRSNAMPMK